jgi:hypothetical protein
MPAMAERIEGLAAGAQCTFKHIVLQNLIEILGAYPLHTGGCSALVLKSGMFESGEPVLAKNFDFMPFLKDFQILRASHPEQGFSSIELTVTSLVGCHDGMNQAGLTILYNYAYTRDKKLSGLPVSMLVQALLQTCENVEHVIDQLKILPRINAGILVLGDAGNRFAVVEMSKTQLSVRYIDGPWGVATNHFLIPEMLPQEMPENARFPRFLPRPWRDTRIRENSEKRKLDMDCRCQNREQITLEDVREILRSHGDSAMGSNNTVCRHSKISSTIASLIFMPSSQTIYFCHGAPCSGRYRKYQLVRI